MILLINTVQKLKQHQIQKFKNILSSLSLSDVGVFLKDGPFKSDIGIVNLNPSKGTYWVLYINQNYLDSYGAAPPEKLSDFIMKRNGICMFSEYKIQGVTTERGSYCAPFCFCMIYLTEALGIDFQSAVLKLYYQRFLYMNDVTDKNNL